MTADSAGDRPVRGQVSAHELLSAASDRPLVDPASDRLGYAPFAEALAKGISSMVAPDGLVVGIYGAWGLGKTTVLNFVEYYLEREARDQFVVIRFNPWWFSGRIDIAAAFFAQLNAVFLQWKAEGEAARKRLANLARVVGALSRTDVGEVLGEMIEGEEADVPALKEALSDALAEQEKRLLIVVDDIDRLTHDEVAELFAVIKALVDLPNTIYLLAFDRAQVARALLGLVGDSGMDYLEKIVQVPFELPLAERDALRALFLDHLQEIVGEVDPDLLDTADWTAVLTSGVEPLIRTPRDVIRLTNSLRVTYTAVKGEVNVVDFIALESLRVFSPDVYDQVRKQPAMFGAPSGWDSFLGERGLEEQKEFHRAWREKLPEEQRKPVMELVSRLFPQVAKVVDHMPLGGSRTDARRARRISEPEFWPLYFRFGLGGTVIPRQVVDDMVRLGVDPAAFGRALTEMAAERLPTGRTRASVMLDELVAQSDDFVQATNPGVVCAILDVGDELWLPNDDEFWGIDNPTRLTVLVGELLRRMPAKARAPALIKAIEGARSVTTPALVVRRLSSGLGIPVAESARTSQVTPEQESQGLVTVDELRHLEQSAVHRIRGAADSGDVFNAPRLMLVLGEWLRWGDRDDVSGWVDEVRSDDDNLSRLLLAVRSERASGRGRYYRINPAWFDRLAERDELAKDVRRLLKGSPTPDVEATARQFLKELKVLEGGKNPDDLMHDDWAFDDE
jgi:predicted KAP-like P-loop ATPase